jgi:hypothetical protein
MAAMMFLTSPVHHAHTPPPPHPNPDKSLLSSTAALEKEEHPFVFSFEKEEGSPNLLHCHSLTILQYHHYHKKKKLLASPPLSHDILIDRSSFNTTNYQRYTLALFSHTTNQPRTNNYLLPRSTHSCGAAPVSVFFFCCTRPPPLLVCDSPPGTIITLLLLII